MTPETSLAGTSRTRWLDIWQLAPYSLVILACLTLKPFWLDEVIQLVGTTSRSWRPLMHWIVFNPGATPLGYLTQWPFILVGGPTPLAARLPSALFSIACCWLVYRICRQLELPRRVTIVSTVIFMILPSQFRYAMEARPYSQALCLGALSMMTFIQVTEKHTPLRVCLHVAATVAALYTQPYAVLSSCGLNLWMAASSLRRRAWDRVMIAGLSLVLPLALFLPWYLFVRQSWKAELQITNLPKPHWGFALAQDAVKGISGGSFVCSAALIALVIAAFWRGSTPGRAMLLSAVLFVIGGALAGDFAMDYFFASRQIIFAIPAISILAALGLWNIFDQNKTGAFLAAGVLLIASLLNDVTYQLNSKEDWPAAAQALARAANDGYCLQTIGDIGEIGLYAVFVPDLRDRMCLVQARLPKVALVSNSYTKAEDLRAAVHELREAGFVTVRALSVGGTTVSLEQRRGAD